MLAARRAGAADSIGDMVRLADRMAHIGTETAFEAANRARALEAQGHDIIHLHLGEPDFDTPPNIVAAAKRALDEGWTHYAPPLGLPQLRQAVAADAGLRRGLDIDPDRVVITPGAKPVLAFALMALVGPGDEVIVPDPGFPIYESMTRFMGATPVALPLRPGHAFRPEPDELRSLVTDRTRLLILNSPGNPTGSVLQDHDLEVIAEVARARDVIVLSDEIYGRIIYEGQHRSIATLPGMEERTIILDGFSKSYAMTGWRLGYGILPEALIAPYERLMINTVSCTASHAQIAAVEALTGPQDSVVAMTEEFGRRRELLVDGLIALPGIRVHRPGGAFYAFPDASETGMTGAELAERLLLDAGVSVLAGTAFGHEAPSSLRISYANSQANLSRALERIAALLDRLPARAVRA
jgi:aspartate/methionine/tyrosine aminotransferase